jgi:hypothetical protein
MSGTRSQRRVLLAALLAGCHSFGGSDESGSPGDAGSSDATQTADASTVTDAGDTIGACLTPASNMIAWWAGDGSTVDVLGTSPASSGSEGGASGLAYGPGEVKLAFALAGSSYLRVTTNAALDVSTGLTVEAWVNAVSYDGVIVDKSSAGSGYRLDTAGNKLRFTIGTATASSSTSITPNEWVHVAGTWDGHVVNVYIDGALAGTSTALTLPADPSDLRIGAASGGASRFGGSIDEVALYSRALSQSEIGLVFQAGTRGRCKP